MSSLITHCTPPVPRDAGRSHRWTDARRAATWVLSKLSAAEQLWSLTRPPHVDYALAMNEEDDEEFFMTEGAQE